MKLSVVIPAYNEEDSVTTTVERAVAALRRWCAAFEIIIVDDGSTDQTGRRAAELAARYAEVSVLRNATNLGQGPSLVAGLARARHEVVTHNAMDYPFHLDDLPAVLPLLATADVVVVARRSRPESSLYRRILTRVNVLCLRNLFGVRLRDYNFVQFYRHEVLESVRFDEKSTGFLAPSLIFQAHRRGYRIAEVVLDYWPRERGEAKSGRLRVLVHTCLDMGRFWLRDRRERARPGSAVARPVAEHEPAARPR